MVEGFFATWLFVTGDATAAFTAPNFHDLRQWDLMEFRSEPPPKK